MEQILQICHFYVSGYSNIIHNNKFETKHVFIWTKNKKIHQQVTHHVAFFGSDVIQRNPVPTNISAIVTSTDTLRPAENAEDRTCK